MHLTFHIFLIIVGIEIILILKNIYSEYLFTTLVENRVYQLVSLISGIQKIEAYELAKTNKQTDKLI